MKKQLFPFCHIAFLVCLCFLISACQSTKSHTHSADASLPRADNRYIGWLEKESIFNASPEKIKIVAGTQFAWNFSTAKHEKKNILAVSPVWLQINPYRIANQDQVPLKTFLNNSKLLKDAQIQGLYFYPTKDASFEDLHDAANDNRSKQYSPVSLSLSNEIGTAKELTQLGSAQIYTAGNILPVSLGIGSDFLLALHGVREYPGLFMMTEVPKELWHILPQTEKGSSFRPIPLSDAELLPLKEAGIIPHGFYRDFFPDFPKSSFALSNEIIGYDGAARRWLYRYVNNPYTAVLNFYDPSFQTQRILAASIIEEIGLLKQGIVSVSVQDIWGQESMQDTITAKTVISALNYPQPGLFTLESINRSVHGYGAWTFCRDAFAPELIKLLQNAQTDFVADTLIMPALEQAFLQENNAPLMAAFKFLQEQKIDEQSLWHGSHSSFFNTPYAYASLTKFLMHKTAVSEQDCSMLKKMQDNPLFRENNHNLYQKFALAGQLQTAFLGCQSLLPGLNIIELQDIIGVTKEEENYAPFQHSTNTNILLFGSLSEQINKSSSSIDKLQTIWKLRQEKALHSAKIHTIFQSQNTKTFALSLETPAKQKLLICLNLSAKPQQLTLKTKTSLGTFNKVLKPYELYYQFF